ncbi:MAG: DUF3299 domain-containing protein [Bacteroidia bacterium]|nr:DUF3299 domain-containing protein [Bacteroidia bacterium]
MRQFIFILFILASSRLSAQLDLSWETLAEIEYSYVQNYEANFWYGTPSFSESVKGLEGKEVKIKGYVLPMDVSGEQYVLSAFPFASCFFCGGAGQESVIELRLEDYDRKFETDEYLEFRGILKLNDAELELNYILDKAQVLND